MQATWDAGLKFLSLNEKTNQRISLIKMGKHCPEWHAGYIDAGLKFLVEQNQQISLYAQASQSPCKNPVRVELSP